MSFELRPYQKEAVEAGLKFLRGKSTKPGIEVLPCGCHAKGYGILMYDGTVKKVEDIKVGDRLMGDEGTVRHVLELHRGADDMYEIKPEKGNPFVVNKGHILHLKGDTIEEMTVGEYINLAWWKRHSLRLMRPEAFEFETSDSRKPFHPYFLGSFIEDGSMVQTIDKDMMEGISVLGLAGKTRDDNSIPHRYLTAERELRFLLLAGMLDANSSYNESESKYIYSTKSEKKTQQMMLLCRSLGLQCYISSCFVEEGENMYCLSIFDYNKHIPVKFKNVKHTKKKVDVDNTVGFEVMYKGRGEYYGFTTDNNHLYLDWQCFIHHNSGKSLIISKIASELDEPVLVLQPSKEILEQNYAKALSFGARPTIYSASCGKKELSSMTYATLKSIKKDVARLKEIGINTILIDEAHSGYSPEKGSEFMEFMKEFPNAKVLGFTATPCRLRTYSSMLEGNYSKLNMLTKDDTNFFQKIIHVTQVQELTAQHFWSPMKYERWTFDDSALRLNSTGAEYTNESIKESIVKSGLNNSIYRRVMQLMDERKYILVCMDSIESCNIISDFMNRRMGRITGVVTSLTSKKEREHIIEDFRAGRLKVVFNYATLATGFDFPELDCVIFGRPTFSYSTFYQVCGRAVRIHPNKEEALIIDCCDNMKRFGRMEDLTVEQFPTRGWCMFAGSQLLSNIRLGDIITKEDIMRKINSRKAVNKEGRREDSLDSHIMWFGKYEGIRFKDIPLSYFRFIVDTFNIQEGTKFQKILDYYNSVKV